MSTAHPLVRMLTVYDIRVRELSAMLGEASLELPPAGDPEADTTQSGGHARALRTQAARRIWFAAPVPLDAFIQPGNRIALVAPELMRRLLAARALFACRDAVRRCVERQTRHALLEGVGATALEALVDTPASQAGAGAVLPEDTSPDALARCGWHVMAAEGACSNPTLRNLIELSLASMREESTPAADPLRRGADDGAETLHGARAHATASSDEMDRFFTAVGRMFPELQWLFG
ncbi:type III secretion protein (HrpB4) [Paraburkholderia phenazinium]|uniref:Type III secretion protein (HrpB4) n=1 Tax=Paraburkholderia phenazinium TaxID=60549 RepID=A0A1G8K8G0_9BURK|nr:type III secretion protein HrpB4 [Paraburkholderia phenazinium]SDI39701.1 type III secretion protein (HrpB4) [Paraburkholderia phenazinium]